MFIVRFILGFLGTAAALLIAYALGAWIFHSILAIELFGVIFLVNGLMIFSKSIRYPSLIMGISLATVLGAAYLMLLSICGGGFPNS